MFAVLLTATECLADAELPHLERKADCTQLVVDGKPFLLLAGELHNSSASTLEYVRPLLQRLAAMNFNTVLAPISWEQFEPEEGKYDFTLIDGLIRESEKNDLKLVVLWFATWKNGQSTYAPMWVKRDTKRFLRVRDRNGKQLETLSPFCDATQSADARAFAALMRRIGAMDHNHTVIMAQPENEPGIFLDMDYSSNAMAALSSEAPESLVRYLSENQDTLRPSLGMAWESQGRPTKGTWTDLFGDGPDSREFLVAWRIATFIEEVASSGQREHPIPMFVNAWLVQSPEELPGSYPNGGPVARVMDIYKAAAPSLFTLAPDIYLPQFKQICARYARRDNPLLIPESTVDPGRAFYALAEHSAIGYSPFAAEERAKGEVAFQHAYAVLEELHEEIVAHQGEGSMRGFLREVDERHDRVHLGRYQIDVFYESQSEPCYGMVIQQSENEFLVSGVNLRIEFRSNDPSVIGYIGQVREVKREDDRWKTVRVLNGDETFHHGSLRVFGREVRLSSGIGDTPLGPQPTAENTHDNQSTIAKAEKTPGVYRVTTYQRAE